MEEIPRSLHYGEDGIDLYELCLVLRKRIGLITGIVIISVLAGAVGVLIARPVYRTEMVVQVPSFSMAMYSSLSMYRTEMVVQVPRQGVLSDYASSDLEKLKNLLKEERFDEASELLDLKVRQIEALSDISYQLPREGSGFFKIIIDVYRTDIIPAVAKGLLVYLNRNPYVIETLEIERRPLISLKKEIQSKIDELESLKNFVVNEIKTRRYNDLGFNPIDLDTRVIHLKQQLNEVEKRLSLLKGYEVVVEPYIPKRPSRPRKVLIIAVAFVTSLFLGVFIAFFAESIKKAKTKRQTR